MAWVLKMDEVIESGLVHDFDASLSGIGQELGAGAYSMRPLTPWGRPAQPRVSCQMRLLPEFCRVAVAPQASAADRS
ncbi:hypothetical protein P7K49_031422 [Saguinus oedipus]|uniref:Uncharacterized protein n=1 Tax=Saguinus oedipus TaxID=9490 RepID=A0ABQ9TZC7_SAGOE|nr:hypothetical protein P7K49_031422 [Saguinus oedipus]